MKRPISILPICAAVFLFVTGCGKTDVPTPPSVPKQAPPAQGTLSTPAQPPPMPEANVPKGAEAPSPKPGQAGDTSNPAFKEGGKADPNK